MCACALMCPCMKVRGQVSPPFYSEDSGIQAQVIGCGSAFTTESSCPTPIFFKDNVTPSTG